MNHWYRSYAQIVENAAQYRQLSDAGEYYRPGDTEVWYLKIGRSADQINVNALDRTHVMIGTLAETDPEVILSMMQSESWDTDNAAESMLDQFGVDHSSMTTGDVIVVDNTAYVINNDDIIQVELNT